MTNPKIRFKDKDGKSFPDWEEKKLGELGSFTKGASLSKSDISDEGNPFILYGELYTTYNEVAYNIKRKTQAVVNKKYYSIVGDVVIPTSGESPEEISTATCIMVPNVILAGDLNIYRSEKVDGRVISYIINHQAKDKIARIAQGKSIVHIQAKQLEKIEVSYPADEREQQKIADFLSNVDEVIAASEEEVANLEQQKKAVMQKIFFQEVRFKKEDGSDFPDWDEKTFEELAKYKKGPFGSALKKEIFVPEGSDTVKVYEQQNAIGKDWTLKRYFITAEYYKKMQSFEVHAGDIIVSCAGTIGEIYILPENAQNGVINQALMRVRENKAVVNQVYFTYIFDQMLSQEGQKLSNGSALKNIPPFADMKKQVVKVPSLPEQQFIADFLTSYDEAIAAAKQELAKWKELKKGLLQQLFV